MNYKYAVICKDDDGFYVLATRQYWDNSPDAVAYARTVAQSRVPIVVEGGFDQMRVADPRPVKFVSRLTGRSLSAPSAREE